MNRRLVLFLLFISSAPIIGSTPKVEGFPSEEKNFKQDIISLGLNFSVPEGFKSVPYIPNPDMAYGKALKKIGKKLEIRYSIRPIPQELVDAYKTFKSLSILDQHSGEHFPVEITSPEGPENYFESEFKTIVLNIAGEGGSYIDTTPMPQDIAKDMFKANFVRFTQVTSKSKFGEGFLEILIIGIHKVGVGSAYTFFLYDNKEAVKPLLDSNLNSLSFEKFQQ